MQKTISFIVVDDHPVLRQGLVALIQSDERYIVLDEVGSASEALAALERRDPDIALIDISLGGQSGLDLIKVIKAKHPHVLILIISMHDEAVYAERSIKAGARGYVMKHEASSVMKEAIKTVLAGKIYLSGSMRERLVESLFSQNDNEAAPSIERLSDRELDVLELLGQGYGAAEIAGILNLSTKTVNSYKDNIREKLSIPNAAELRRFAIRWVHSGKD